MPTEKKRFQSLVLAVLMFTGLGRLVLRAGLPAFAANAEKGNGQQAAADLEDEFGVAPGAEIAQLPPGIDPANLPPGIDPNNLPPGLQDAQPVDPKGDEDGDGISNDQDPDIDGDGVANENDDDQFYFGDEQDLQEFGDDNNVNDDNTTDDANPDDGNYQ